MKHISHLEKLVGPVSSDSAVQDAAIEACKQVEEVLNGVGRVEANKNKTDLAPNVAFVSENGELYEEALICIIDRMPSQGAQAWAKKIQFRAEDAIIKPQVDPDEVRYILARMPKCLIDLSALEAVSYQIFDDYKEPYRQPKKVVPIPGFDDEGNFEQGKMEFVPIDDFPRKKDHPSRIMVGVSTGKTIYPTPLPSTVSENRRALYLYQVHVLLHEFFHTVDCVRRDSERPPKIIFEVDGERFTFEEWWKAFEELVLSGVEPQCISSYAMTYEQDLTQEVLEGDHQKFSRALAEQIAETFVAYQFNIISNNEDWTDFMKESFGNKAQLKKFINEEAQSANLKWLLMDKLCRAEVIDKGV